MRKVWYALILSVLVHLLLVEGVLHYPVPPPSQHETVEIEIKPLNPADAKKERQIVRQALVPDKYKVEESEDPLRFLSAERQRVKKQMRAAQSGMTQNRQNAMNPRAQQRQLDNGRPQKALPQVDKDALIASARQAGERSLPRLQDPGMSTIGESLPNEVQIGSFTALNTDRYLFYSFYARIEDLIRFRWETAIERAIETTPPEKMAANIQNRWVTQIEILLNAKGEFLKAMLMKPSGNPAFDQAAANAFASARYFPNPPQEMVEDDHLIHLKYSFTVYYDPHAVARPF